MAPSANSPLMDRAPAEIRLMIFRLALRMKKSVTNSRLVTEDAAGALQFETPALFIVSKQVFNEAQDAFFEVNTIQLRTHEDLHRAIAHRESLQHVELKHGAAEIAFDGVRLRLQHLTCLVSRPRIKTITIASNNFRSGVTTRKLFGMPASMVNLRCLEIGLFEMQFSSVRTSPDTERISSLPPRILLKNTLLLDILPQAKVLLSAPDACLSNPQEGQGLGHTLIQRLARSFARWLKSYELLTQQRLEPGPHWVYPDEMRMMTEFERYDLEENKDVPWRSTLMTGITTNLQDLEPTRHSSELLEWATELMALNLYWLFLDDQDAEDG